MRRRVSYFWALYVDDSIRRPDDVADGLDYAVRLAEDGRLRAEHVRQHTPLLPRLTINDVAETAGVSPAIVRRRIAAARRFFWGELSDSGIYYRIRRQKQLNSRADRWCEEPNCEQELPWGCSAGRRYCDTHRSVAARVSRYRRATKLAY
jgi:hypothetical protein